MAEKAIYGPSESSTPLSPSLTLHPCPMIWYNTLLTSPDSMRGSCVYVLMTIARPALAFPKTKEPRSVPSFFPNSERVRVRKGKKGGSAKNAPRHQNLSARDERDVAPLPQDGPQALEPPREDVHRQLPSALLLLDEERDARHEPCAGNPSAPREEKERREGVEEKASPENQ